VWLEMSRDEAHGGAGWEFTTCLWSPARKRGGESWPYWDLLLRVREGETVFHLRGSEGDAKFVGFSTAAEDGATTFRRPPEPGDWAYANEFNYVPLTGFTPFLHPIPLRTFWAQHDDQLRQYYRQNREHPVELRKRLFFVIQAGRLQCQNGAYFSELDHELASLILSPGEKVPLQHNAGSASASVHTSEVLRPVWTRIGQDRFSDQVRRNYSSRCCFPGCGITDSELLTASHIGRWADDEKLRGEASNGLCFCLMHDKAFESGFFTLDSSYSVRIHKTKLRFVQWGEKHLKPYEGRKIELGSISPSHEALRLHWSRIRFVPE
jgi:putative restriction endonuclease